MSRPMLRPLDRWAGQPAGFCRPVADVVYKAIMSMPDEQSATVLGRVIVGALVQEDLLRHGAELAKAADAAAARRTVRLRRSLAREAVSKAASGQDASDVLRRMAILAKAWSIDPDELSERAKREARDLHTGRFVRQHESLGYDPNFQALDAQHATQVIGVPPKVKGEKGRAASGSHLHGKDQARFQQAYAQLHSILRPYAGMHDHALVHLHIHNANDPTAAPRTAITNVPTLDAQGRPGVVQLGEQLGQGEYLHSVSVSVVPPTTTAGSAFDALSAVSPGAAGAAYRTFDSGAGSVDGLHAYRDATTLAKPYGQDDFIPSQRAFRNLSAGAELLNTSIGPVAPKQVQYALAVAQHAGKYGPEAQKVIGPAADRAAYRYRGTEAPISPRLANALRNVRAMQISPESKREMVVQGGVTSDKRWDPGPVLSYFHAQLPKANLNSLQLASGRVPPSRGIVLDRNGRTVAEAVGYGDDHYLPFNLKGRSLRNLKGGEYIRTRTFGGPTTEDIYTGLMSGANAMTVVSHNGVYTVDFQPDLKGGRRFNDNAARMVATYGHILDAVQSEQVRTGGLDPSRYSELEAKAAAKINPERNPEGFAAERDRLIKHEYDDPKMSEEQKQQAALTFFQDNTDLGLGSTADFGSLTARQVTQETNRRVADLSRQFREWNRAHPDQPMATDVDIDHVRSQVSSELAGNSNDPVATARKVAESMNLGRQFDAHMRRAEQDNKDALTPLRLNGEGYATALDALQEQFPHYIKSIRFVAWNETGKPGAASRRQLDTGYVKPQHNRPAAALAGYFDQTVGRATQGKVTADSIRWQNGNRTPRTERQTAEAAGRRTPAAQTSESTAPAAAAATPQDNAARKAQAARDLFDAIKGQSTISANTRDFKGYQGASGAVVNGVSSGPMAGKPVAGVVDAPEMAAIAPVTRELFTLTRNPEEFDRQHAANPSQMDTKLRTFLTENDGHGIFDLPSQARSLFERGGAPAERRQLGEHPAQHLRSDADRDYDLGDAYDSASGASTHEIQGEYERAAAPLISTGRLPAHIEAPEFGTKSDALLNQLRDNYHALEREMNYEEYRPGPGELEEHDANAEALIRARQLKRRHGRAAAREAKESAEQAHQRQLEAAAAQPDRSQTNVFVGADGEDLAESLRNMPDNLRQQIAAAIAAGGGDPGHIAPDPKRDVDG